jgi:quercetin dioxygenase-like cupin family protein
MGGGIARRSLALYNLSGNLLLNSIQTVMQIPPIPFQTIDWATIPVEKHDGETGFANWRVQQFGDIRIRMVEYSPGYKADHWCNKGHVIFCVKGEMVTTLEDGRQFTLSAGMNYIVGDNIDSHCTHSEHGVLLFIVD